MCPRPCPQTVHRLSVLINVAPLGTPYTWNHTGSVLLCVACVTEDRILKVHLQNRCRTSFPFKAASYSIGVWTTVDLSLHLLMNVWVAPAFFCWEQSRSTSWCMNSKYFISWSVARNYIFKLFPRGCLPLPKTSYLIWVIEVIIC